MTRKTINRGFVFCAIFLLSACSKKEIFSEFRSFPGAEWPRNEKIAFEVKVEDIALKYDVSLEIRNNNNYPFRNIWLFVDVSTPAGQQRTDTINAELADVYGKWHGRGISLYSYSFLYETNIQYPSPGTYIYSVRQGMREETLKGVSDVGLTVAYSKQVNQ